MLPLNLGISESTMHRNIFYYKTKDEFDKFYLRLKQKKCPHCGRQGFLILHGFLPPSYQNDGVNKKSRGRRIFCSNRKNRTGCGKTFSIVICLVLKRFIIDANILWKLLRAVVDEVPLKYIFNSIKLKFSLSWFYWIWNRFKINQSRIRTKLSLINNSQKHQINTASSYIETILQLKNTFPNVNPIAEFQYYFQEPFLK